jgi:hypothetical protein
VKAIRTSILPLTVCCLAACATATGETKVETAPEQHAQTLVTTSKPLDDLDKVVCKKVVPTGSRIPERHCKSRRAWLGLQRGSHSTLEEMGRTAPADPVVTNAGPP